MIKKLCIASCLILKSNSFSFYKMEGIYYDPSYSPYSSKQEAQVFRFESWEKQTYKLDNTTVSLFLYDHNTFTQLHCECNLSNSELAVNENKLNFLNCKPDICDSYPLSQYISAKSNYHPLFYRKQPLIFHADGRIERKNTDSFSEKIDSLDNEMTYQKGDINYLYLGQKKSFSNVLITESQVKGKKEVILSDAKDDYISVSMTEALRNYFVKELDQNELADSIAKSYSASNSREVNSEHELRRAFSLDGRKTLKTEDYNRLQNSTILAIWCLILQKKVDKGITKTIQSEMIGLARDERTDELYHWTTDLGQDISVLLKYKPKRF